MQGIYVKHEVVMNREVLTKMFGISTAHSYFFSIDEFEPFIKFCKQLAIVEIIIKFGNLTNFSISAKQLILSTYFK